MQKLQNQKIGRFFPPMLIFTKNALSLQKELYGPNIMKYDIRDIFEYIIALVNEFAKRFGLSDKQAYQYIRIHNGVAFIEQNYGIIHTLDFDEAVDSVAIYCRRSGGEL